jgi:hypothetical protein
MVAKYELRGAYSHDAFVKSRSHTKFTEVTKKNLNLFNMPFFVPLCLRVKQVLLASPSAIHNVICFDGTLLFAQFSTCTW